MGHLQNAAVELEHSGAGGSGHREGRASGEGTRQSACRRQRGLVYADVQHALVVKTLKLGALWHSRRRQRRVGHFIIVSAAKLPKHRKKL